MKRKLLLNDRIRAWLRLPARVQTTTAPKKRGAIEHVVILDGTMSSMVPGQETNAGITYRLLAEVARRAPLSLRYEQGAQWLRWRDMLDVIEGRGINSQIRQSYGFIASRYRPGDRIWLFGYSRGAYAVRSLAGMIDRIGLLKAEHATERNIRQLYRHYQTAPAGAAAQAFADQFCHRDVEIEMIGVWDTVKSLGLRGPVVWRYTEPKFAFHDHQLGPGIKRGFHALALDERREAYKPIKWASRRDWPGELEQVWFRGTHGDVGGHLGGYEPARPLANIPLVWMLEKAAAAGLALPDGWQARFVQDASAPSVGSTRGWGKLFVARRRRKVGTDPSESIHPSAGDWARHQGYGPGARRPRLGGWTFWR